MCGFWRWERWRLRGAVRQDSAFKVCWRVRVGRWRHGDGSRRDAFALLRAAREEPGV